MKTVLIAGGAGFLGSHLTDHYCEQGHSVVCVDNLSTGRAENVQHLKDNDNFTFVQADITETLPKSVTEQTYDIVINLASPASPPKYQELALETLRAGSIGTEQLLELAKRDKARFFHASTSEVYGDAEVHPQPETYWGNVNSYGPRSMYDEAKRYAEALVYVYRHQYGVDTTIARFFNTYGPRMDKYDGRVVSNFINQALEGKDITIYGDGSQTRSFCYVDDLIEAIVRQIDSTEPGPLNLGNPQEYTVAELAELVLGMVETSSKVVYKPMPGDDPKQRKPDIAKASKVLDWQPKVPVKTGLRRTIDYFATER